MSTLQYKFIRTSTLLFMGLKTRCKQSEYFTWWGVPSVNMKYMPLPILYCGTVMEAIHNAVVNRAVTVSVTTASPAVVGRHRGCLLPPAVVHVTSHTL